MNDDKCWVYLGKENEALYELLDLPPKLRIEKKFFGIQHFIWFTDDMPTDDIPRMK